MVELPIADRKSMLHVKGADTLCSFKSSLEIQLIHVAGVRADPEVARSWWHGIRMPGTNMSGVITAGTGLSGMCIIPIKLSSLTCVPSATTS
jgi:hypothetical protein